MLAVRICVLGVVAVALMVAALPPRDDARASRATAAGTRTNIYVISARGGRATRITANPQSGEDHLAYDPSWSPDGRRLAFTEIICHSCPSKIHIVPARPVGSGWLRQPLAPGYRPKWSPNGKRIAFVGSDGGIYVMNVDGSHRRLLVKRGFALDGPTWSPDSKWIAFTQQKTASLWRLYRIAVDGTRLQAIPTGGGSAVSPAWSPKGATIAFARQAGVWRIYSVGVGGKRLRRISRGVSSDSFPTWSPDGRRLAFVRQEHTGTSLWTMTRDGKNVRRLTRARARAVEPAWSPRGDKIAYAATLAG